MSGHGGREAEATGVAAEEVNCDEERMAQLALRAKIEFEASCRTKNWDPNRISDGGG